MYRLNKRTSSMVEVREPWRGCTWTVALEVNGRQSIETMTAVCTRRIGPDIVTHGSDTMDVAPFDDLGELMRQVLLHSALASLDEALQLQIPFESPDQPPAA